MKVTWTRDKREMGARALCSQFLGIAEQRCFGRESAREGKKEGGLSQ